MPRPTQAHLERTVNRKDPIEDRQKTLNQMHYYMGAKLVEVRVDPQKVMYRWSVEDRGDLQHFTLSAFWGESQRKILSGENPLQGEELANCAKANASVGVNQAAKLCGFASDIDRFRTNLQEAIQQLELPEESFDKLLA
ncbi:hypothetical protein I4641_06350 [Waterburya agarophytonicola K14]|uniref:Uncharacterized protein n=1 Tax=Waterburya agarophytonicola KI4 TaxID=2874699 RepID=A0A964BNB7_9CYAN|nr:hypothetical protein [Waterburya agarophytonicola]MCC0176598.1 hypothetical protein [Waterburya agarophytonicola KI4]